MEMAAKDKLIVAFDSPDLGENLRLAKKLQEIVKYAKIGSVLFTHVGPDAIKQFKGLGFEVFLDLKFHDIPSTVEKSCQAAARHGIWMLTVHACAQAQMLEAAVKGASNEASRLGISRSKIVGVTVLTSVSDSDASRTVVERALEAKRAGLDGVVASAQEAKAIKEKTGKGFTIVCPGIRMPGVEKQDQKRTATPGEAIAAGADFIVVGRPITGSDDPMDAVNRIVKDMER